MTAFTIHCTSITCSYQQSIVVSDPKYTNSYTALIYQTCQRLIKPRSVRHAFILSLFSSNHTRMIWPDDLSPARGEMFSPDRNQKHIIKDGNTAGSRSSPLSSSRWTVTVLMRTHLRATGGNKTRKVKEIFFLSFSVSLPILLSLCPSVSFTKGHCSV